jgi:hypothetical protein
VEREIPLDSKEFNQLQIKNIVEQSFGALNHYLITNLDFYPNCCLEASGILKQFIKKKLDIDLPLCQGRFLDKSDNSHCEYHGWLEYGDLIIDPTDYQFQIEDIGILPFTEENFLIEGHDYSNYSKEEFKQKIIETYRLNKKRRYLEHPNEKEKYFLELKNLVKNNQLDPEIFSEELKRCFGCKIFYSKKDKRYQFITETVIDC